MSTERHHTIFSLLSLLTQESCADIVLDRDLYELLHRHMVAKQSFLLSSDLRPKKRWMEYNGVIIRCAEESCV